MRLPPTDAADDDEFAARLRDALPRATRLAARLTNDAAWAEDVAGEAMLRAVRSRDALRDMAYFDTWLYRVVVNAFRDSLRRRRARDKTWDKHRPTAAESCGDASGPTLDAERAARIAARVSDLPPRQREAVVLTFYEQMSAADAAAAMGTTPGNVRVLLHQARTTLKRTLAEYAPEADDA